MIPAGSCRIARSPVPTGIQVRKSLARKERLLGAASRVLLRSGVHALTLEAVAREAGTSKGGLLHHFPSKAKLQESLLKDIIARVKNDLDRFADDDPDLHGRRLRAYIRVLVAASGTGSRPAVLATLLFDPVARLRWRDFSDGWLGPDLEGQAPDRVDAVRALADGSWLAMALGIRPVSASERAATLQRLLKLTLS